jgi:hypothetical protein
MFTRDDLFLARGLKKILDDGTFPLMAKEVSSFAKIYTWVGDLDARIEKHLQETKMEPMEPEPKAQPSPKKEAQHVAQKKVPTPKFKKKRVKKEKK